MPTVRIEYNRRILDSVIEQLAEKLPGIVAPQMNIDGNALHMGGVGESEIMVDAIKYSQFARNVNDIQITVIAHRFGERVLRLEEATDSISLGVEETLQVFDFKLKIGVSVWLVDMGYALIKN